MVASIRNLLERRLHGPGHEADSIRTSEMIVADRLSSTRKRLLFLSPILMACIAIGVSCFPVVALYYTALGQQKSRLVEVAKSQARLVEAIGRHNNWNADVTLGQIREAQKGYAGIGDTGEFTLAYRDGKEIRFLLRHRHGNYINPPPAPFYGTVAEPMRRALKGQSGVVVGQDYRGETVVAAHEPIAGLGWGIVAKIDRNEVRAPFLRAAPMMMIVAVFFVGAGSLFLVRSGKRVMAQLEDREARTRAILQSVAEGIVTINEQGVVESFNEAAATMFGYQQEEVVGQNISMLMPSPHGQQHDQYVSSYLRTGQAKVIGHRREVEGQRKGGTTFPIDLAVSEIQTGRQRLFTGIVRDMTESKKLQCELAQAQKMESIGQLAAGIAHEINTPTQFVGDNSQFVKDAFADIDTVLHRYENLYQAVKERDADNPLVKEIDVAVGEADLDYLREEIPRAIDQSLDGVERIATIVRAMKEFSHPGAKEKTLIDMNRAIETTITVARNEWKYAAEVVTNLDPELPEVLCQPGELNQVLLNLIVNAAHAIADVTIAGASGQGVIAITTRHDNDWIEIRVADTGTGIPEEIRTKIFDPFFTTKDQGKGTGQGLTMVHNVVVEKHGGTIRVETKIGKGTTFVVRLPVGRQSPSEGAEENEEAHIVC